MKKTIIILAFLFNLINIYGQGKTFLDQPFIEVTGTADTSVVPDEIYIHIRISESDMKNKISIEEMEKKMVEGLVSLGINIEKQMSTKDIQSNFRFYALKQKDVLKSKEYILKVGDANMAMKVLIKLEDLGISNANIDHVAYSKMNDINNQLRTKASLNAKQKALVLTTPLGATLDKVLYIADFNGDIENKNISTLLMGKVRGLAVMSQNDEVADIKFEKIQASVTVQVKFGLK